MRILFQTDIDFNRKPSSNWTDFDHDVGGNTGNLMFANALQYALSFHDTLVRRLDWPEIPGFVQVEEVDLVVINCANWLRPRYVDFLSDLNLAIGQIDTPVIMIGLGTNVSLSAYRSSSYGSLSMLDKVVKELIANVERTKGRIGVRGKFTQGYFDYLGGSANVVLTGCPSVLQFPDLNVGLLTARSKSDSGAVGYSHNRILDALENNGLVKADYFICQDWAAKFLLFPDELTRSDVRRILALDSHIIELLRERRVKVFTSIGGWLQWVSRRINRHVGGRIHGGLLALHARVPSLFYRHGSRLAEFIELYELPFFDEVNNLEAQTEILREHDWSRTNARFIEMKGKIVEIFNKFGVELNNTERPMDKRLPIEEKNNLSNALSAWWLWVPLLRYKFYRLMVSFFVYRRIRTSAEEI